MYDKTPLQTLGFHRSMLVDEERCLGYMQATFKTVRPGDVVLDIDSLGTRTEAVPRWLTMVTYIVVVGILLFAGVPRAARFVFSGWVFLMSVCVLILDCRFAQDQEGREELTLHD